LNHYGIVNAIKMAPLLIQEEDPRMAMMDWNQEAIDAAQTALRTVNETIDEITMKATKLESLLVLLAHTAASEDLPTQHREHVCWLGSELANEIRTAAKILG
jgi:hypothetical protein